MDRRPWETHQVWSGPASYQARGAKLSEPVRETYGQTANRIHTSRGSGSRSVCGRTDASFPEPPSDRGGVPFRIHVG